MKNWKILCCFAVVLVCPIFLSTAFADVSQFKDVQASHWAYGAIQNLAGAEIIKGFPDHTFRPQLPVNREQFAVVLTLTLGFRLDERAPQTFADVDRSHWAFLYIDAVKAFVPTPNPKGYFNFNGSKPITREEVAVSLAGALNLKPDSNANSEFLQRKFKDYRNISPEYQSQIALIAFHKIMAGNPDGTFNSKGFLTRAELCVLADKLLTDIETQKAKIKPGPGQQKPAAEPQLPWTLKFLFERPDYDLVKSFTGVVSEKVYGPTDYYLVLDNKVLNNAETGLITKTVNMYVYADDLQWFYEGDMLNVDYDRKNNISSYRFERQAKPLPYQPPVGHQ